MLATVLATSPGLDKDALVSYAQFGKRPPGVLEVRISCCGKRDPACRSAGQGYPILLLKLLNALAQRACSQRICSQRICSQRYCSQRSRPQRACLHQELWRLGQC
jgi:hypothetical protein